MIKQILNNYRNIINFYFLKYIKKLLLKMLRQQVSWKKQNKSLEDDAQGNVQLKKQINKESDMDLLIQNSINDKVYDLKLEATQLTKKYENQKYKNLQLQTIIKTIKCRMEDDHKIQASSLTQSNFQNIQSLERKIKKYEYDLEQVNTRANKVGSVVTEKKHKVSLLRTQRVIDSSIFRNIQKQLIDSEMEFKKLLIEKVKYQKQYEQCLSEYSNLKSKAQQYFLTQQAQKAAQLSAPLAPLQQYQNDGRIQKDSNTDYKFKEIERHQSTYKTVIIPSDSKQEQNLYYEFKIKKLLMNLNLSNVKEYVYIFHNIQQINDQYFRVLNLTGDESTKLQEQIKKLERTIQGNAIQFYKPKTNLSKVQEEYLKCSKIKKEIERVQTQQTSQVKVLNSFASTDNFKSLIAKLQISALGQQNMDLESVIDFMKELQQKFSSLNCHQCPKQGEQSMILKTGRTQKQRKEQKLEDIMSKIKVYEQSDKIMRRQQFKEEYKKMLQGGPSVGSRPNLKKKTKKVTI